MVAEPIARDRERGLSVEARRVVGTGRGTMSREHLLLQLASCRELAELDEGHGMVVHRRQRGRCSLSELAFNPRDEVLLERPALGMGPEPEVRPRERGFRSRGQLVLASILLATNGEYLVLQFAR